MVETQTLQLVSTYGIAGDINAGMGNPRQVLLAEQGSVQSFGLQPGDLRENILVDTGLETLVSGQGLQMGSALIRLMFPCEPCAYLETLQPGLARHIKGKRGFLGMVAQGGEIAVNETIALAPYHFPPLPDETKGRFEEFVARIPLGKIVTTPDLILALGVSRAYYRTLPIWLKKASPQLPVHRIVAIDGRLFPQHLPNQAQLLSKEGIRMESGKVDLGDRWNPEYFHDLQGEGERVGSREGEAGVKEGQRIGKLVEGG
jgi:alkylated DNA nucleotide flippase Atl1